MPTKPMKMPTRILLGVKLARLLSQVVHGTPAFAPGKGRLNYRAARRVFHGLGRARAYGRRVLRINKDRFKEESSSFSAAPDSSPSA